MDIESIVEDTVKTAIVSYLDKKSAPSTKHVILDSIFPTERRIRSIMGGLETSIGTKIWEKLSYEFARKSGFEIKDTKKFLKPKELPKRVSDYLSKVKQKRENSTNDHTFEDILSELHTICKEESNDNLTYVNTSSGDGIDMWFVKDSVNYIFDTKTVQINAGGGNNFANKVLHWYAYFWLKFPNEKIIAGIVFPYSPYGPTFDSSSWWKNNGNRAKPMQREKDAFVQDEFWDLITGTKNSWSKIKTGISRVDSAKLIEKYSSLFYGR